MSRILVDQIRSNSASSDALTLDGSGNLTIPGNLTCSGNASISGTPTGFGGGKVLQVVHTESSTNVTTSGSTKSDILNISITPASTSNKILCILTCNLWCSNGTGNAFGAVRLYRGGGHASGTDLIVHEAGMQVQSSCWLPLHVTYVDSPSTTSATSYYMTIQRASSQTTSVGTEGKKYTLTAMEIGA